MASVEDVWTLKKSERVLDTGRMGASGLPWGTASGGEPFRRSRPVQALWRAAVSGRPPFRPISIAEAVVFGSVHALARSCWSASRTQALQQKRCVRTAHHGSLRLGVCITIVLRSKRNNGCFRLVPPALLSPPHSGQWTDGTAEAEDEEEK